MSSANLPGHQAQEWHTDMYEKHSYTQIKFKTKMYWFEWGWLHTLLYWVLGTQLANYWED